MVGWVERSEPHQNCSNGSWWGSGPRFAWCPSTHPTQPPLETLAAWCQRFSPLVGIERTVEPASLLLDITGLAHLFGGEAALAEQVLGEFAARGMPVQLAVADTLGAAWALAHYKEEGSRIKDKGEMPFLHPSSFILDPSSLITAALGPLPIEALRLPVGIVELLHSLGIWRIGQLEPLPREELAARFGPRLAQRWDQATGRLAEPLPVYGPPPRFRADWSSEYPAASRERIGAALERLIGRLSAMLGRGGRGALRLQCRLWFSTATPGEPPREIAVGLFEATARGERLFPLVQLQLERLRLPGPVRAMTVEATLTGPLEYRQQELFADDALRWQPRRLAGLIERLSSRLGAKAVVRPRLLPEAQPELACRYVPLVGQGKRGQSPFAGTSPRLVPARRVLRTNGDCPLFPSRARRKRLPAELPPRPLRLLARPRQVAVTSLVPDGPLGTVPIFVAGHHAKRGRHENGTVPFPGAPQQIVCCWGPERIETGWWRGRTIGRDYYRVETAAGRRWWLFRRLRDGQWFLHGTFD
jgi:protein ImuB